MDTLSLIIENYNPYLQQSRSQTYFPLSTPQNPLQFSQTRIQSKTQRPKNYSKFKKGQLIFERRNYSRCKTLTKYQNKENRYLTNKCSLLNSILSQLESNHGILHKSFKQNLFFIENGMKKLDHKYYILDNQLDLIKNEMNDIRNQMKKVIKSTISRIESDSRYSHKFESRQTK